MSAEAASRIGSPRVAPVVVAANAPPAAGGAEGNKRRAMSAVIFPELVNEFASMHAELEASPLVVVLAPSRRAENPWDMIRVPLSVPPPWYRSLCAAYASSRGVRRGKFDTRIKRRNILRALGRMSAGEPSASLYAGDLLRIAARRLRQPARRAA